MEALFRKGDKVVLTGRRNRVLRRSIFTDAKFYLRKSLLPTDAFLQWGGMAILAVILYGNLVRRLGRNESGGRYVYYDLLVSSFLFCSLSFYCRSDVTNASLIV